MDTGQEAKPQGICFPGYLTGITAGLIALCILTYTPALRLTKRGFIPFRAFALVYRPLPQSLQRLSLRIWKGVEHPAVPGTNDVVRYELERDAYYKRTYPLIPIGRSEGEALLRILSASCSFEEPPEPPDFGCRLLAQPTTWVSIIHSNGSKHRVGFYGSDTRFLYFDALAPIAWGKPYFVQEEDRAELSKILAALRTRLDDFQAKLRREIVSAQRPCVYGIGTVEDGGTLSGVARLFYGDAGKWRQIYQANRDVIKNPDVIHGDETITIP